MVSVGLSAIPLLLLAACTGRSPDVASPVERLGVEVTGEVERTVRIHYWACDDSGEEVTEVWLKLIDGDRNPVVWEATPNEIANLPTIHPTLDGDMQHVLYINPTQAYEVGVVSSLGSATTGQFVPFEIAEAELYTGGRVVDRRDFLNFVYVAC